MGHPHSDTDTDTDSDGDCDPDVWYGELPLDNDITEVFHVGISPDDIPAQACGDGQDIVASFSLGSDSDVYVDILQFAGSSHSFALYEDIGGECTAGNQLDCFDPGSASESSTVWYDLPSGAYYIIAEENGAGSGGTAVVTLTVHTQACGNDVLDPDEECDDGNLLPNDGCNPICQIEPAECVIDEDLGLLVPGEQILRTLDVAAAGDEWATDCSTAGQDVVLQFETDRTGNIHLYFTQQGDHAVGLYPNTQIDAFLCEAVDGVCLDKGEDNPGYVIFMGRPAGIWYLPIEALSYTKAGIVDITLWLEGCTYDEELGDLFIDDTISATVDTVSGLAMYEAGCAGLSGNERVIKFHLDEQVDLELTWSQSGDHVFGLFEEAGGACDDTQVTCEDSFGDTVGNVHPWATVGPGDYLLIVDAFDPGDEGVVQVWLSAHAP